MRLIIALNIPIIIYDNNVWKTGPMDEELAKPNSNVTAVSDIVTEA